MTPTRLTRPNVGLSPTVPHSHEGLRIDPPVSVPSAAGIRPAATPAAEPLLDPPVKCPVFHGLRAGGHGRSNDGPPCANSCVVSLPSSTPPAAYKRAVVAASSWGTWCSRMREHAVVRIPFVSNMSFKPKGTPCIGPLYWPDAI